MLFDELLARPRQRVADCLRSGRPDAVLGDAAWGEAAELWQAAQPADPEHPTPEDHQRVTAARQAVGWLHFLRFTTQPTGADPSELARTVVFLAPLADDPTAIPDPLRLVLGPAADADQQADLGFQLAIYATTTDDHYPLDAAITLLTASARATPHNHPAEAGRLSNLGSACQERFERSGVLTDLEQAIEALRQAVAATPDYHPNRTMMLANLGVAYLRRFERSGVLADLEQAIEALGQAVAAAPAYYPERGMMLSDLGGAYMSRFARGGVLADLERAIENGEQAVAATPADHPDWGGRLCNLGNAYLRLFERGGVPADLERAIEALTQAVAATPADHRDRGIMLSALGGAYLSRFARGGVPADLERAIEALTQAVAATPADHPNRAMMLSNLGYAYQSELDGGGHGIDPETLHALAEQVAATLTTPPVDRATARQVVGSLAHAMGEHTIAAQLLDAAAILLPLVAPRESGWADQEHRLGQHLGLVGEAVAAHCAIDDPVGAVEAAELGRGVLLAAELDARTDLTALEDVHPDLAAHFRRVRDQLNTPETPHVDLAGRIADRKRWWEQYDQLLEQIREHPDFARFLLPPRLPDLQPAAAGGAVVLVNSGRRRSDAIIVTADGNPVLVPLPDLILTNVRSHGVALLEATRDARPLAGTLRQQRVVPEVLGWLWDTIVEPILDALPPPPQPTSPLPRVWWLPIGLLGLFPLHAAGRPGQDGTLDTVISSYTPTLRALAHSRTRLPAPARRQLTVALHHTPGLPDLDHTIAEANALRTRHRDTRALIDQSATTGRVLAAVREATWAHFACHAAADLTAPSRSGLCLHDGTLPVADISRLRLNRAELAYLSACSTADRGVRLADESLHLASAFQLAGFRHVIASLWPLNDRLAATAAAAFYQHLPATPAADHAATALHQVIRELRDDYPDRPDLWAALIHNGA